VSLKALLVSRRRADHDPVFRRLAPQPELVFFVSYERRRRVHFEIVQTFQRRGVIVRRDRSLDLLD
jgi:hypothetical protein